MRISSMVFKRLGSLANVELSNLKELTVLIGKNGSGKSYVLDGLRLFFTEFQTVGGASSAQNDPFLWHQRRTKHAIEIGVSLDVTKEEGQRLVALLPRLPKRTELDGEHALEIRRTLNYQQGWKTESLRVLGAVLVEKDEWVGPEVPAEPVKPATVLGWKLYLFGPNDTPEKIEARALLVKDGEPIAYETDEDFNALAAAGWLSVSTEAQGQDPDAWASGQGWSLAGRIPNEDEAPELWEEEKSEPASAPPSELGSELNNLIKNAFTLIPAARHVPSSGSARDSLMAPSLVSSLTEAANSQDVEVEEKWYDVKTHFEDFVDKELDPNPSQFLVRKTTLRLPHQYIGGGEQSVLQIAWELQKPTAIVAIEEPETHLHPSLGKSLFQDLKRRTAQAQIFVGTHSPMFVDKSEEACNWLLRLKDLETKAERVSTPEEMKLVMAELGLVPSDIFLKDLVVFVEGATEEEAVLPLWAERFGLHLRANPRVGLLAIGGNSQAERFLKAWLKVMEYAPADYIVLLDAHAGSIRDKLEAELNIPQGKIKVLTRVCIEDFYPGKLVLQALHDLFQEDIDEKELPKDNLANFLNERLGNKARRGWKVQLGTYVAARMERRDVPEEISQIFEQIKAVVK